MRTRKGLSDFWRCDRSDDRVLELASVLQGTDVLIGNMGSDIRVTWSGAEVSYTDFQRRIVALDYGPLKDSECPFPGTAVDEVIGYAAHEGGHCLWSPPGKDRTIRECVVVRLNSLPQALQRDWQADPETTLADLCRIQNVLEDAHTDHRVAERWPVLGEYIRIARERLNERVTIDIEAIARAEHPDRNAVMNLWLSTSLYCCPVPEQMSAPVKGAMEALLDLTLRAVDEADGMARQRMAVEAAIVLWKEFPVREAPLPTLDGGAGPQQCGHGQTGAEDSAGRQGGTTTAAKNLDDFDPATGPEQRGRKVVPVPKGLLEQVAEALAGEVENVSQSVAQILAEDPRQVVARARKARYDPGLALRVMTQVQHESREIQRAFRSQQDVSSRWLHGLDRGKLDDRSLWKPFVGDPGYYKRKDAVGKPNLAVGLLLDVSGSMSGYMPIVEQTAAVFYLGLREMPGLDFAAWCYTGQAARVCLTRICDHELPGLCLAGVDRGGSTPSGAAIAAARVLMERMPEKRKLLIHFTDGRPDSAAHVSRAIEACQDAGIQVYAIGLVQHKAMLSRQYGEASHEVIQTVPELPEAVARIVKRLGAADSLMYMVALHRARALN